MRGLTFVKPTMKLVDRYAKLSVYNSMYDVLFALFRGQPIQLAVHLGSVTEGRLDAL